MARIAAGSVTLHDARNKERWVVDLEPFEIGVYALTQEQVSEAPRDRPQLVACSATV